MKKTYLILTFLLTGFFLQGQNSLSDSVRAIINQESEQTTPLDLEKILDYEKKLPADSINNKIYVLKKVISLSQKSTWPLSEIQASNKLADIFLKNLGQHDSAFYFATRALHLAEKHQDEDNYMRALNIMGLIYSFQEKPDKSIEIYLDAYNKLSEKGDSKNLAMICNNLGMNYGRKGNLDEAERWYLEVIRISEKLKLLQGILQGYNGAAAVYNEKKEMDKALQYAKKSLRFAQKFNHMPGQAIGHVNIGRSAFYMGDYKTALDNYLAAYKIFEQFNDITKQKTLSQQIAQCYQELSNYKKALDYTRLHHDLKDSIFSMEKTQLVEELQTQYETEKIQREKEQAEVKNLKLEALSREQEIKTKRQQALLAGVFSLLGVLVIFGLLYTRQQKIKKQAELTNQELQAIQKRLHIEQQKRKAELKAVRSQLNPHFIFNVIHSVQDFVIAGDKQKANKALTGMAHLMQKTLKHSELEQITLKDELEVTQLYLEAEKLRFEDKLDFKVKVDEEVEDEFIKIPPMIIQPYVENAIKHGLKHKAGNGIVEIAVNPFDDEHIKVFITDNGVGREKAESMKKNNAHEHNSFSSEANEARLKNLSQNENSKGGVEIIDLYDVRDEPAGTQVILTIPVN